MVAPTFSPAAGTYTAAQTVTISTTTSGASIRYTINGTTPTETVGALYSGPVSVSVTTTIKAIAYKAGMTDSPVSTAAHTITGGSTQVTVSSAPPGRSLTVDGSSRAAPCVFQWTPGSSHTIATTSPQAGGTGTQYVFANWSDGGALSHSITVPASAATYTASFTTQYYLTTSASPASGGTINPASGWYNSNAVVSVSATPASSSWTFTGFSGALSGTATPQNLTMNAPATVTASFVDPIISVNTSPVGLLFNVDGAAYRNGFNQVWAINSSHTLSVPSAQEFLNDPSHTIYVFSSWTASNGQSSRLISTNPTVNIIVNTSDSLY